MAELHRDPIYGFQCIFSLAPSTKIINSLDVLIQRVEKPVRPKNLCSIVVIFPQRGIRKRLETAFHSNASVLEELL